MKPILALIFLTLISRILIAGETIYLANIEQPTSLGKHIDFIEDAGNSITINELIEQRALIEWQTSQATTPSFGYTNSAYWFHLTIENNQELSSDHQLEIGYPMLNFVDYFLVANGTVTQHQASGGHLPYNKRVVPHRNFVFDLKLAPNSKVDVYFKISSQSSLQVPISIAKTHAFYAHDQNELINKSVYYGMMLVMILYNLFLFVSLREIVYLYYICFVFSLTAVQFCLHGLSSQYLWPENPFLQDYAILIFVPCCVIFASLFTRKFLNLPLNSPKTNRVFELTSGIALLSILGALFLNYALSIKISIIAMIVASSTCLFIGPYLWSRGYKYARFYSVAWLCITLTAVALGLSKLGLLPRTYLTENGLQIGAAAEAVLLSLALADRLNRERSERFRAEAKLIFTALHHPLTGVPNRAYLVNWLDALSSKETIDKKKNNLCLALIHLHRFHEVNKTLGHQQADKLLKIITTKINDFLRSTPSMLCIEEIQKQQYYLAALEGVSYAIAIDLNKTEDPKALVKELVTKINEPIEFESMLITVGGVAGLAHYSAKTADGSMLIRNAQIALDRSRLRGKAVVEYSEEINPYNERRLTLAGELRHAMLRDDLELYFQPKVNAKTNTVTSMEALLRWDHPEHGFIPPDEFIPIAEQAGLINALTVWVLDSALDRIAQLNELDLKVAVAVNISAINLKDRQFPEMVKETLAKYAVDPAQLSLEVTESAMMDDPDRALEILKKLSALGIRLSIDDFGTGYSSLAYIRKLPVQEIKIDRSFVMEMDKSKSDSIIVQTTVNMCHDLSLEVVAEGVETDITREALKAMGCDYLQGYHFSRPLPFDKLVEWLNVQKQQKAS